MKILEPIAVTDAILLATNVPENEYPVWSATAVYAPGEQVIVPAEHKIYQQLRGVTMAITLTIGAPCEVNWPGHTQAAGQTVKLTTTGALPTGLTAGQTYYVVSPTSAGFRLAATSGGAAIAVTGTQSGTHTITCNEVGQTPSVSELYWKSMTASNTWKMFDAYNNTATEFANSITVSLKPSMICNGIYLGGLDANSVTITVVDPVDGVVYTKTENLVQSNSRSSMWNWYFQRIKRRNMFVAIDLPPYLNATINISIQKAGATAKCAMCCIGTVLDTGATFYGVATSLKDWSTTQFAKDGTSTTVERGYSKNMTLDVKLNNDMIDDVQDALAAYKQKPVVFIGIRFSRWTVVYGKYSSFKNVIEGPVDSRMALSIEGTI